MKNKECAVCGCAVEKEYTIIIDGELVTVCYECYKTAMGDDYWD